MKIAILTNAYPPDGRGGAEHIARLQAEGLASRGHEVRVWCPGYGLGATGSGSESRSSQPVARIDEGIDVSRFRSKFHLLESMNALSRLFFHLGDVRPRADVVHEIITWKPDVLISHNLTGCGIGTPSYVQRKGVRWMHVLHDIQLTEPSGRLLAVDMNKSLKRAWRAFWARHRGSMFFGQPDVLASPTKWLMAWHENYGFKGKQNTVLPNPVEAGEAGERTPHHPGSLLYVGRLDADKGFDLFLQSIKLISPDIANRIVIVGSGVLETEARKLNDPRMDFRGWVDPQDVRNAIRAADVLIAPSRILENQQTIILEAMAEGTPVIATDVGGTRETLEETKCPVIPVTSNIPMEVSTNVRRLLEDNKAWCRISQAMRERAGRHDVKHYLEILEKVLNR